MKEMKSDKFKEILTNVSKLTGQHLKKKNTSFTQYNYFVDVFDLLLPIFNTYGGAIVCDKCGDIISIDDDLDVEFDDDEVTKFLCRKCSNVQDKKNNRK